MANKAAKKIWIPIKVDCQKVESSRSFNLPPCINISLRGHLHFHGYPMDIGHGSIYDN